MYYVPWGTCPDHHCMDKKGIPRCHLVLWVDFIGRKTMSVPRLSRQPAIWLSVGHLE